MTKTFFQRALIILFSGTLLLIAGYCGFQVSSLSNERAQIKKDYGLLNNINFGLLSVNAWRDHLVRVVSNRIDDFEFSQEQEKALNYEVSQVLHAVINKADSMLDKKQKTIGGKLKKIAIKTFVKEDKLHAQVPVFAKTIVDELKKPKNKKKLKFLAESKLKDFSAITYDSANDIRRNEAILKKYEVADLPAFNIHSELLLSGLQKQTYFFTYVILSIMLLFLVIWWAVRNHKMAHKPLYVVSVLVALVVLVIGLTSPMIEIDARIKEMTFLLMGEDISFHDQVIFFQSKSIVDVVRILIQTGKYDSAFVGILIVMFSIIFPIGKLLSTGLYLLGNVKLRDSRLIKFFAFKSGKWSMADVMVIAIFMAYIGFKGILDSQMESLNMKTDSLASISTNETSLQPGFILFTSFVLFGLILASILERITSQELLRPKGKSIVNGVIIPA